MSIVANLNYAFKNKETVWIGGGSFSPEELKDAAQKIAQRNELLECLIQAVGSLEWAASVIGDIPQKSEYMERIAEAKAIIAKATGETK